MQNIFTGVQATEQGELKTLKTEEGHGYKGVGCLGKLRKGQCDMNTPQNGKVIQG